MPSPCCHLHHAPHREGFPPRLPYPAQRCPCPPGWSKMRPLSGAVLEAGAEPPAEAGQSPGQRRGEKRQGTGEDQETLLRGSPCCWLLPSKSPRVGAPSIHVEPPSASSTQLSPSADKGRMKTSKKSVFSPFLPCPTSSTGLISKPGDWGGLESLGFPGNSLCTPAWIPSTSPKIPRVVAHPAPTLLWDFRALSLHL